MSSKNLKLNTLELSLDDRIKMFCAVHTLKGVEFARLIGISPQYLTDIRGGKKVKGNATKFWRGVKQRIPSWEKYLRGDTDLQPDAIDNIDISQCNNLSAQDSKASFTEKNNSMRKDINIVRKQYPQKNNAGAINPVNDSGDEYQTAGQNLPTGTEPDYLDKTRKILQSPSIFNQALKSNIDAFYEGVLLKSEIILLKQTVKEHGELLNQLKLLLPPPAKENAS